MRHSPRLQVTAVVQRCIKVRALASSVTSPDGRQWGLCGQAALKALAAVFQNRRMGVRPSTSRHPQAAMDQPAKRRFLKYVGLGVIAFIIDALVFQGVVSLLGASPYVARVASFIVATSAAWWMNRTFTFHDAENIRPELQWAKFFAANLVGGGVNYLMFALTLATLPLTRAYPLIALAVGSLSGVAFNYTAYKRYVFRTGAGSRSP